MSVNISKEIIVDRRTVGVWYFQIRVERASRLTIPRFYFYAVLSIIFEVSLQ